MANIFLKYPSAASPTTTIEITRKFVFPVPADEVIKKTVVTTMGGRTYVSRKSPLLKRISFKFQNLPDGDNGTDYTGIRYFFANVIIGGQHAFDFVDMDGTVSTVRLTSDPQSGQWQKDRHGRNSGTLVMEKVI